MFNDKKNILVTGGAGFIGSNLLLYLVKKYPRYTIVNLDKLTYAGNLNNLSELTSRCNYFFEKGDICDQENNRRILKKYDIDTIIHLAAESHVDRSIEDPFVFAKTNVLGTLNLLQASKDYWEGRLNGSRKYLFYHISTDEVYGSLNLNQAPFTEDNKYEPHSPYSASKASSDHFVRAFKDTYALPVIISNCSNNYGPYQYPEKLIPLCISKIIAKKSIPVYGKGENIRDWLYVEDHVRAIDTILHKGIYGQTYNIGGGCEMKNIDLVRRLISIVDRKLGRAEDEDLSLITYVEDRKGHDLRYAIDCSKLMKELKWSPLYSMDKGLENTVNWYLGNQPFLLES